MCSSASVLNTSAMRRQATERPFWAREMLKRNRVPSGAHATPSSEPLASSGDRS